MTHNSLAEVDEVRASILTQIIRRDYLEQMLEKAKMLESTHKKDYPPSLSEALKHMVDIETQKRKHS